MHDIILYTRSICPYCVKAKLLLDKKGLKYKEINIEHNKEDFDTMLNLTKGRKSVPQIFINGFHVGGSDDLYQMNDSGDLDSLLNNK